MNHHYFYRYIDAFWFTSETDKYNMTRQVNNNIIRSGVVQYFNTFVIIVCMQFDLILHLRKYTMYRVDSEVRQSYYLKNLKKIVCKQ